MSSSFRHKLIRAAMRNLLKPLAKPNASLSLQRSLLDRAALTMRMPGGTRTDDVSLGSVPARKIIPRDASAHRHLLYLHGGAYIEGSIRSHTSLAAQIATAANATTWLIDYRLAPEHPHPAALEDAVIAYRALLDQGIPARAIVMAGDSAGGGLALAAALAMRDAALPMPAALVLLSPWTDLTLSGASMQNRADIEPMLNADWLDWAAGLYCGGDEDTVGVFRTDPGVSPLFADLAGLPPMLIHVGSDEILLDDSTCLAARASAAGIAVSLHEFAGLWHVFQTFAGTIPEADESLREVGEFCARHFAR